MEAVPVEIARDALHRQVCLFVSSSDNTRDVFRNVIHSYEKFWSDCPYPRFVGLNSSDGDIGRSFMESKAAPGGWRRELLQQVTSLPGEVSHILLMLDDFLLLSPVDGEVLDQLVLAAVTRGHDYTRLVPMASSLVGRLLRKANENGDWFVKIPAGEPYFSSLQPALWKRSHLVSMLQVPGSIWDFENQSIPGATHYAIARGCPIRCAHVVEKGRWMPDAGRRFRRLGIPFNPGTRPRAHGLGMPVLWYRRVKFSCIGYAGFRLRDAWKSMGMSNG